MFGKDIEQLLFIAVIKLSRDIQRMGEGGRLVRGRKKI